MSDTSSPVNLKTNLEIFLASVWSKYMFKEELTGDKVLSTLFFTDSYQVFYNISL